MWSLPSEEMTQKWGGTEDKKQLIMQGVMKKSIPGRETACAKAQRWRDLLFEDVKEQCDWNTVMQGVSGRKKR